MRNIAVTGAAGGIGHALSKRLEADGHRVIALDLNRPAGLASDFLRLDLTDRNSIADVAEQIGRTTGGTLDGLCNAAGVPPIKGAPEKVLAVNFTGTRAFTEALLPRMSAGARIVSLASRAGHGWPDAVDQVRRLSNCRTINDLTRFCRTEGLDATRAYNLSKEALILWSMALTEPLVHLDIATNTVSPGAVSTGILDDFLKAFGSGTVRNIARAGRPAHAEEVATTCAFLLSSDSAWCRGSDLVIDGGISAFCASDRLRLEGLLPREMRRPEPTSLAAR